MESEGREMQQVYPGIIRMMTFLVRAGSVTLPNEKEFKFVVSTVRLVQDWFCSVFLVVMQIFLYSTQFFRTE